MRNDPTAADDSTIPKGATVPAYCTFNLGMEENSNRAKGRGCKICVDVVNLTGKFYESPGGSAVGVNAAQFGPRRGLYGSVGYKF